MKIAIPTENEAGLAATVAGHFGHAPCFTFVEAETDQVRVEANGGTHHGGTMTPAEILINAGTDVVLCGGLGRRAVRRFEDSGIAVMVGAEGTVKDALLAYREGRLAPADEESACPGHDHDHS